MNPPPSAAASAVHRPRAADTFFEDSFSTVTGGPHPPKVTVIDTAVAGGSECAGLRVGANCPALFFSILVPEEALVTISFQELSSAGRCLLLLSPTDPHPTTETAVWRLASPETAKTLVIHPADDNYRRGQLFLAVRYLEGNGSTRANLRVRVQPSFYSIWYRREVRSRGAAAAGGTAAGSDLLSDTLLPATAPSSSATAADGTDVVLCSSLYIGAWSGRHHSGRGVSFYAAAPLLPAWTSLTARSVSRCISGGGGALGGSLVPAAAPSLLVLQSMYESRCLPWSALSLLENPTLDNTALDAAFIARITGIADTRQLQASLVGVGLAGQRPPASERPMAVRAQSPPLLLLRSSSGGGSSPPDSCPPSPAPAEGWRLIAAPIYDEGLEAYDGEWARGRKEGHGVYQWTDRAYIGGWAAGVRHGYGELRCRDGSYYLGDWRHDRRHGYGEAFTLASTASLAPMPTLGLEGVGNIYRGEWRNGLQEGPGSLEYPNGVIVDGPWSGGALVPGATVTANYPDGMRYVGGWRDDCRHGAGSFTDAKRCVHVHTWSADRREGPGIIRLSNGVRFDGRWQGDGLLEGVYGFPNGDAYRGGWNEERMVREGRGTCRSANGDEHEGDWLDGQRHGAGVMRYADTGAVYTGQWAGDLPSGEGRFEDADGVYEGNFVRGERSGYGTQTGPDGSVYRGHWQRDMRAGQGTQRDATHNITYTGIFLHDRLQGAGSVVRHAAREAYDGTWLDGLEQGHGTLQLSNGDVMRGVWMRGEQVGGHVQLAARDGGLYIGDWQGAMRCGYGTQVAVDGASVYQGEWLDDKPHGRGVLTSSDGQSVTCEWSHGAMIDGPGSVEFADGSVYTGDLRRGVPHGQGTLTYPDETVFQGSFLDGVYNL